jgi:phosphate starvation-inducible PhoH-like protein
MGEGAKIIVTGDVTQVDLPRSKDSGLVGAARFLKDIPGIAFVELDASDVVRHPLVREILAAYEKEELRREEEQARIDAERAERRRQRSAAHLPAPTDPAQPD